jgi:protein gp37
VFPSLCDPFEMYDSGEQADGLDAWRGDFFALIDRCPNLDFLLLTKRPQNVRRMWPLRSVVFDARNQRREVFRRENVWLFYSASDQASLESGLPDLLACRDLVPVLGLSLEPLIGPVNITRIGEDRGLASPGVDLLDFVIVGGESGLQARPCDVEWIRSIRDQCAAAGVPCFVKQLGAYPLGMDSRFRIADPKASVPSEWSEDLRVQEFPQQKGF